MKHHCHCGFEKRHQLSKGKRLGALGATFMILHLLYHVAECLILPAVFMAFSNHSADEAIAATDDTIITEEVETTTTQPASARATFQADSLSSASLENSLDFNRLEESQPIIYELF